MTGKKLCRTLAFLACGAVLLETSGCASSILPTLANLAVPLVLDLLLSGLVT